MITEQHKKIFAQCKACGKTYSDGLLSVKIKSKWGFINTAGELVIPAVYDNVKGFEYAFHDGLAVVVSNSKYGIIDKNSVEILPCEYDTVSYEFGRYSIQKDGKTSIAFNNYGSLVITSFSSASLPIDGYCIVRSDSKKKGLIKIDGSVVANAEYDDILSSFHDGIVTACKGTNLFLISDTGAIVKIIDTKASGYILTEFKRGLARVQIGDSLGIINTNGDIVLSPEFERIELRSFIDSGCIKVQKNGKFGLINPSGTSIVDFKYDEIEYFCDGLISVTIEDKCGLINSSGESVTDIEYDSIKWGDLDYSYLSLIKIHPNKEGKKYSWGKFIMEEDVTIMDLQGKIIGNICSHKVHMSNGLKYIVMNDENKYGLCDCYGKYLIPTEYSRLAFCTKELFIISKDGKAGYCDMNGKMYTEFEYNELSYPLKDDNFVLFRKGNEWSGYIYGIVSNDGKVIADCEYSEIHPFVEGFAVAKREKLFGLIDENGHTTFE